MFFGKMSSKASWVLVLLGTLLTVNQFSQAAPTSNPNTAETEPKQNMTRYQKVELQLRKIFNATKNDYTKYLQDNLILRDDQLLEFVPEEMQDSKYFKTLQNQSATAYELVDNSDQNFLVPRLNSIEAKLKTLENVTMSGLRSRLTAWWSMRTFNWGLRSYFKKVDAAAKNAINAQKAFAAGSEVGMMSRWNMERKVAKPKYEGLTQEDFVKYLDAMKSVVAKKETKKEQKESQTQDNEEQKKTSESTEQ